MHASTYLGQCLKTQVMSFDSLNAVVFGEPSVPIHHEGDMFRYRALTQCADQKLTELVYCPFGRRGGQQPLA